MSDGPTTAEFKLLGVIKSGRSVDHSAAGATVRASTLQRVLLGHAGSPRTLILRDMRVAGTLDLEAGSVAFPVEFVRCTFVDVPIMEQATLFGLYFTRCELPGFRGAQVKVRYNLEFKHCPRVGGIDLIGARIDGQLLVVATKLVNPGGEAMKADGLVVKQDLKFTETSRAEGLVKMVGARIGGELDCDGATFGNPGQVALNLGEVVIKERTYWRNGFRVDGGVCLDGAHLSGRFDCTGAVLHQPAGKALFAEGLVVESDVKFDGATVHGEVDFTGCDFRGTLDLTGGRFHNPGRAALDLARVRVGQNLICRSGFVAQGEVLLAGADIGGGLWCEGGRFENGTGNAVQAAGLRVHRDLRLGKRRPADGAAGDGFRAEGPVVLTGCTVGGDFDCSGGQFVDAARTAIDAVGMSVKGDLLLLEDFTAEGLVQLSGTEVDGSMNCTGGHFRNTEQALRADRVEVGHSAYFHHIAAGGPLHLRGMRIKGNLSIVDARISGDEWALVLQGTQVEDRMELKFGPKPVGGVDLRYVSVSQLDDGGSIWPDRLWLNDFTYKALSSDAIGHKARIECLKRNHKYAPQVYLHLAKVYERTGQYDEAKHVLIAGEDAKRGAGHGFRKALDQFFGFLLKWTVWYGYRPLRVVYWIIALAVVGSVGATIGRPNFVKARGDAPGEFQPVLYTLDLLIPVVNLRQRDHWVPLGWTVWGSAAFTALGWILAICLVTGLGKAFRREL